MARVIQNPDRSVTIVHDDGRREVRVPEDNEPERAEGEGNILPGPTQQPSSDGDRDRNRDAEAGDASQDLVNRTLQEYEEALRRELSGQGDISNSQFQQFLRDLQRGGLSANGASQALSDAGQRITSNFREQQGERQGEERLVFNPVTGQYEDVQQTGGGQDTGFNPEEFFNFLDLDTLQSLDLDEGIAGQLAPIVRESDLSLTPTGRAGLFNQFLTRNTPVGAPDFLSDALGQLGDPLSALFALNVGSGDLQAQPVNVPVGGGGFEQFFAAPSFSTFAASQLGNLEGTGGLRSSIQSEIGDFLDFIGNADLGQLQIENPLAFETRQRLVNDPTEAFQFIAPAVQQPALGQLGNIFRRNINQGLNRLFAQNPQMSGLDFLSTFANQGLGGFF